MTKKSAGRLARDEEKKRWAEEQAQDTKLTREIMRDLYNNALAHRPEAVLDSMVRKDRTHMLTGFVAPVDNEAARLSQRVADSLRVGAPGYIAFDGAHVRITAMGDNIFDNNLEGYLYPIKSTPTLNPLGKKKPEKE